jgi:hypothetical protein
MGDRSNIVVVQPDNSRIWLYGHWMGDDNYRVAGQVLALQERWNDSPYLTRMLFAKMTEASPKDSSTGYGISNTMCDNEYPIVVIDPQNQSVHLENYIWGDGGKFETITPQVTFEEFVNAYSASESLNDLAVNMGSKLVSA